MATLTKIFNNLNINQLKGVSITLPTSNQVLSYDNTTNKWINTNLSSTALPDNISSLNTFLSNNSTSSGVLNFNNETWSLSTSSGSGTLSTALTSIEAAVSHTTSSGVLLKTGANTVGFTSTPSAGQYLKYNGTGYVWDSIPTSSTYTLPTALTNINTVILTTNKINGLLFKKASNVVDLLLPPTSSKFLKWNNTTSIYEWADASTSATLAKIEDAINSVSTGVLIKTTSGVSALSFIPATEDNQYLKYDGTGYAWSTITSSGGTTSYTLPTATTTILGGIKIGSGLTIDTVGSVSINTVSDPLVSAATTLAPIGTTSDRTYQVQKVETTGQLVVNVPWVAGSGTSPITTYLIKSNSNWASTTGWDIPTGWTITTGGSTDNTLTITHNLNKFPSNIFMVKKDSTNTLMVLLGGTAYTTLITKNSITITGVGGFFSGSTPSFEISLQFI